jgi:hypothetical protein
MRPEVLQIGELVTERQEVGTHTPDASALQGPTKLWQSIQAERRGERSLQIAPLVSHLDLGRGEAVLLAATSRETVSILSFMT